MFFLCSFTEEENEEHFDLEEPSESSPSTQQQEPLLTHAFVKFARFCGLKDLTNDGTRSELLRRWLKLSPEDKTVSTRSCYIL
jgi:hypothetical protein